MAEGLEHYGIETTEETEKMAIFEVIKCEAPAHTLVWKHPAEDFNTRSTLIVDESQAAVFYKNGQAADIFTAGRYILSTQNIPILRKLIELPTGGVSSFSCKVYFVNLVEAMNIKWGLNSKVSYMEPVYQIPVAIGMRGAMSIQVGDPGHLIVRLIGTESGISAEELANYFRSLIVMRVKNHAAKVIAEQNINIFTIDSELEALAEALREKISQDLGQYGIRLKMFTVDEVIRPEDDPLYLRVKRSLSERSTGLFEAETKRQAARIAAQASAETEVIGAQGHRAALDTLGTNYQQERQFDISETMAANSGNGGFADLAGSMAMMPGAIAMGNMAASAMNFSVNLPGNGGIDAGGSKSGYEGTTAEDINRNIPPCPNDMKKCGACGAELPMAAKFCFQCGQPQERMCPNCGNKLPAEAKFCLECGTKL